MHEEQNVFADVRTRYSDQVGDPATSAEIEKVERAFHPFVFPTELKALYSVFNGATFELVIDRATLLDISDV